MTQLALFPARVRYPTTRQTRDYDPASRAYRDEDEVLTGRVLDSYEGWTRVLFDGEPMVGSSRGLDVDVPTEDLEVM